MLPRMSLADLAQGKVLGVRVVGIEVRANGLFELVRGAMRSETDLFLSQSGEPALDLIYLGSGSGREMDLETGMTGKPVFTAGFLCVP